MFIYIYIYYIVNYILIPKGIFMTDNWGKSIIEQLPFIFAVRVQVFLSTSKMGKLELKAQICYNAVEVYIIVISMSTK